MKLEFKKILQSNHIKIKSISKDSIEFYDIDDFTKASKLLKDLKINPKKEYSLLLKEETTSGDIAPSFSDGAVVNKKKTLKIDLRRIYGNLGYNNDNSF